MMPWDYRMPAAQPACIVNDLIASLPAKDRKRVLARCESVELEFGTVLCEADQPYGDVYFPLECFISLVTEVSGHPQMEIGLIGSEGMLGATLMLGVDRAPLRGVVQGPGSVLRMTAADLRMEVAESPKLARALNHYLYVLLAQLSQTAVCTRFHEVEARLARWLLMTHDRAHADHFHLTHQYLADMLGVQRSAVTIAAGALQKRRLIHYTRGEINVLSRPGLEAASCECYAAVVRDYAQVFG
jgi:CRP-like cAMP-binding protein